MNSSRKLNVALFGLLILPVGGALASKEGKKGEKLYVAGITNKFIDKSELIEEIEKTIKNSGEKIGLSKKEVKLMQKVSFDQGYGKGIEGYNKEVDKYNALLDEYDKDVSEGQKKGRIEGFLWSAGIYVGITAVILAWCHREEIGAAAKKAYEEAGSVATSGYKKVGDIATSGYEKVGSVAVGACNEIGSIATSGYKKVGNVASSGYKKVGSVSASGYNGLVYYADFFWNGAPEEKPLIKQAKLKSKKKVVAPGKKKCFALSRKFGK